MEKAGSIILQEVLGFDSSLAENGAKRALGHIAGMIGDCGVTMRGGIDPDLVRSGSLSGEREAGSLQSPHDLPVSEAGSRPIRR